MFFLFQQILSLLKAEAKKIEKPICAGSTTGPIIIHCTTASAHCKHLKFGVLEICSFKNFKKLRPVSSAGIRHWISIVSTAGSRYSSIVRYSSGSRQPAASPIKYGLGYRSQTRTVTLNPNCNPNPNHKSNNNVCSAKQHRNKVQHSVIYKSYFCCAGGWVYKRPTPQILIIKSSPMMIS